MDMGGKDKTGRKNPRLSLPNGRPAGACVSICVNPRLGQYLAEIVILISLVVAAIVGIQTYMRRGLQAKFKDGVDAGVTMAQAGVAGFAPPIDGAYMVTGPNLAQYEPYYTDEVTNLTMKQASSEKFSAGSAAQQSFSRVRASSYSSSGFNTSTDKKWE
jgi:hypothetical protein